MNITNYPWNTFHNKTLSQMRQTLTWPVLPSVYHKLLYIFVVVCWYNSTIYSSSKNFNTSGTLHSIFFIATYNIQQQLTYFLLLISDFVFFFLFGQWLPSQVFWWHHNMQQWTNSIELVDSQWIFKNTIHQICISYNNIW